MLSVLYFKYCLYIIINISNTHYTNLYTNATTAILNPNNYEKAKNNRGVPRGVGRVILSRGLKPPSYLFKLSILPYPLSKEKMLSKSQYL